MYQVTLLSFVKIMSFMIAKQYLQLRTVCSAPGDSMRDDTVCVCVCVCPLTQFNLCVLRQQHVLALDISVDDLVLVEMGQTLETAKQTVNTSRLRIYDLDLFYFEAKRIQNIQVLKAIIKILSITDLSQFPQQSSSFYPINCF